MAAKLNQWQPAAWNGHFNNELYIGRLVWNRLTFMKNRETGKRVSKLNPEEDWIAHDVPELRIIDDELWQQAKDRQKNSIRKAASSGQNNALGIFFLGSLNAVNAEAVLRLFPRRTSAARMRATKAPAQTGER